MARLRTVEAWPMTRHAHSPWHEDEDLAAFLGSSRGLFELYSDELPAAEQTARASSIRFFVEDTKCAAGFGVSVFKRFFEGFDMVRVSVPEGFSALPAAERARAALDVIHAAVKALGHLRDWDVDRLDEVRHRVESRGLRFRWSGAWKTSPGRRHQARGVYWIDDDGHGHVQLEVRRYDDGAVIARSEPALAFMTVEGFKRSAATLRWHSANMVTAVAWSGILGDTDLVQLEVTGAPAPLALPQPLPAHGTAADVTTTVLTGEEDDPDLPWVHLREICTLGSGAYGPEFERVSKLLGKDADFAAWWAQTPFRTLFLRVSVPDPQWREHAPKAGARRNGKDLVMQVVTERAGLPPKSDVEALRGRAREDLHGALVRLAASRKLSPPPPLPARIYANARQWRAQATH